MGNVQYKYPGNNNAVDNIIRKYIDQKNLNRQEYGKFITEQYQPYKERLADAYEEYNNDLANKEKHFLQIIQDELTVIENSNNSAYTKDILTRTAQLNYNRQKKARSVELRKELDAKIAEIKGEWSHVNRLSAAAHHNARGDLYLSMIKELDAITAVNNDFLPMDYIPANKWKDM
jgi:hypothetical protein